MNKEEIIAFEEDIAACYLNKQILAPIHLEDGSENYLIEIFKDVGPDDWILGTWRSHVPCLLRGVPKETLKKAILEGRSISLCFKDYKVLCSAIVTGVIPIGLGIAYDIKRKNQNNKVWVFVGDMSATTGIFHEAITYARNHKLPITYVISDNGKSVVTDTRKSWNTEKLAYEPENLTGIHRSDNLIYFKYDLTYQHAGVRGQRIQF